MYSNQSFGGANRGPGSQRPKSRPSNIFVDLGFIALTVACAAAVGYQYMPLLSTSGYNVAAGRVDSVREFSPLDPSGNWGSSYSSGRSNYLVSIHARYSFTAGGKQYRAEAQSMPLLEAINFDVLTLQNDINKKGLAVRYDQNDPQKNVPVEVIDHFTKSAIICYVCIFVAGMILLTLAGMSNLTGEKWRPGMNTDAY